MKKIFIISLVLISSAVAYSVVSYEMLPRQERCMIQEKLKAGQRIGSKEWDNGYDYGITCQLKIEAQDAGWDVK